MAVLKPVPPVMPNRALVVMQALFEENPEAFCDLVAYIEMRRHTFEVTLRFHGHAFRQLEYRTTSKPPA